MPDSFVFAMTKFTIIYLSSHQVQDWKACHKDHFEDVKGVIRSPKRIRTDNVITKMKKREKCKQ